MLVHLKCDAQVPAEGLLLLFTRLRKVVFIPTYMIPPGILSTVVFVMACHAYKPLEANLVFHTKYYTKTESPKSRQGQS